jgi:hypothetical protein
MNRPAVACVALAASSAAAWAEAGPYTDGATAAWFRGLASQYTQHCCDQADCKRALADYRDGGWWALSNRTGTRVKIRPDQITSDVSIFKDAILCEGDPLLSYGPAGNDPAYEPRVYCFAPPPIGF